MKRICIISIFREGEGGGEGMAAYELARVLSKDYQVRMLCPGSTTGIFDNDGLKEFRVNSFHDRNLSVPLLSQDNIRAVFNFLDKFTPDVVHAHSPALLGIIGQFWALTHNVPFFYTAHVLPLSVLEFGTGEVLNIPPGLISVSLIERYLLNFYENCDALIALNRNAEEQIREFGFEGQVFTIPNGRNIERFTECKIADIQAPDKVLTFIGFLNQRKNQAFLIEMMKYLPENYRLWLIGDPLTEKYRDDLKNASKAQGVDERVTFVGSVPVEEIPLFLEKSHLLVSASKLEVQSLVVIEAMASGTPVVGLSNETVDELVHPDNGVCLAKGTRPEAFAAEVMRICTCEPDAYAAMCDAAREAVCHQDWKIVSQSIVEAYEKAIIHNHLAVKLAPDIDRLYHMIAPIPAGQLRNFLQRQILDLAVKRPQKPKVDSQTRLIIGLTIYGSILGYYLLKGPVPATQKFLARLRGEK